MANEKIISDIDWRENKKFILSKIDEMDKKVDSIYKRIEIIQTTTQNIELKLSQTIQKFHIKASFWGAMSSLPATMLSIFAIIKVIFNF